MRRMVVTGIGNRIMRDDGIGVRVIEAIQSRLTEHGLIVVNGETDLGYCFDQILPDDFLVVVDAMDLDRAPGSIGIIPFGTVREHRDMLRSQHEFSLLDIIGLHYPRMRGYLIGIQAAEIGFGLALSDPLNQCFEQICSDVLHEILNIKEEAEDA